MKVAIRFYRDQEQQPRVQALEEQNAMADYLESDLQDSATITEILQKTEKEFSEKENEISGNSYTLLLTPETITLENLFDDEIEPYQLDMEQFRKIVQSWLEFLDNPSILSLVPRL